MESTSQDNSRSPRTGLEILGRVEAWDPPAEPDGPGILTLRVESVSDIPREKGVAYKNLLKANEGRLLRVLIPAAIASGLNPAVDERVEFDVRRGRSPDHVFARPKPFGSSE